ncbi:uncharacterized protein LOC114261568 [Camellia sinensis]|uniref:uncharacterized protein LOC114261568 n=1 Tax=Camellia sinensis TaxID=4442 RepID=UPI001035AFF3|nr:uncharacterized protein LOC114261568 [Camellia sinensis]
MAKLSWCLQRNKVALWVKVLGAKYNNPNLRTNSFTDLERYPKRNIGIASSLEAKFWALRDGLNLALDEGYRNIEVETDSLLVKQLIMDKENANHHLSNLIHDCKFLLKQLGVQMLNHIYREGNCYADILANQASPIVDSLHIFDFAPPCIANQLYDDARGISYPRTLYYSI